MAISWEAIVGLVVPVCTGAAWVLHRTDKRLSAIESANRLLSYRLEQIEGDAKRREARLDRAIVNITNYLAARGFNPRSQLPGCAWPTDDPPTVPFLVPPDSTED